MFGTKLPESSAHPCPLPAPRRGPEDQEAQAEWAVRDPGRCAWADAADGREASAGSPVSEREQCTLGRLVPTSAKGSPCSQELYRARQLP